ncbi:MAG: LEA type 2 family protein [Burkholderiales bacterium]|nr:LEA type 2 family protein [Burkholderiales bacterium]
MPTRRLCLTLPALLAAPALAALGGCAGLPGAAEAPRVMLVGLEPLAGEGMELRFAVKLRVQNPNPEPLRYDGVSLDLDLRGQGFASGVAPLAGGVPAWGETVLTVPVTASAFALARQLLDFARDARRGKPERITYALRGRLGAVLGGARFAREGEIDLGELMR